MKPTTEQIIDWGRTALNEAGALIPTEWNMELLEAICSAAYEAGRKEAQSEQEPVAWRFRINNDMYQKDKWHLRLHKVTDPDAEVQPLYTAPPQREWQGMTDEDIEQIHYGIKCKGIGTYSTNDIYRAIEVKLKEKNT